MARTLSECAYTPTEAELDIHVLELGKVARLYTF
jgi:hypothetical protein